MGVKFLIFIRTITRSYGPISHESERVVSHNQGLVSATDIHVCKCEWRRCLPQLERTDTDSVPHYLKAIRGSNAFNFVLNLNENVRNANSRILICSAYYKNVTYECARCLSKKLPISVRTSFTPLDAGEYYEFAFVV